MDLKKRKKLIIGILIGVVVLIVAVPLIVLGVSKAFTAQESGSAPTGSSRPGTPSERTPSWG